MAKLRKASDVVKIEGLPESTAIWSMTVQHPNGDKYEKGPSKGQVKKVTQYALDSENKQVIDDGLTADRDKVITLKYDGSTCRWLESELNKSQQIFVQELRGYELLCKADDLFDKVQKLIETSMNAQNVRVMLGDLDTLRKDGLNRLETAFQFTANKIAGIRDDDDVEKPVKPRKFGI